MSELSQAIAITAELTGTNFSEGAAEMLAVELSMYDRPQVLGALAKCRRELKSRLTMAAIIERLDDGRPGPEEAWALIPKDESQSAVWTDEMAQAFGVALPLIDGGEIIPARMAFKEAYLRMVAAARDDRTPVNWVVTLGHDKAGRERALESAVSMGRIGHDYAKQFVPELPSPAGLKIQGMLK